MRMTDLLLKIGAVEHVAPALLKAYLRELKVDAKNSIAEAKREQLEACIKAVQDSKFTGNQFPVTAWEQRHADCVNALVALRKTPNV